MSLDPSKLEANDGPNIDFLKEVDKMSNMSVLKNPKETII